MANYLQLRSAHFSLSTILFLLVAAGLLWGCSVTDTVTYEDAEGYISAKLFDDVRQKRVATSNIIDQLGEPVLIETIGQDVSVMTYRFSRLQTRNMRVFYVLQAGGREQDVAYFHVAYKGEQIKKSWVDDNLQVQKVHKLVQEVEMKPKNKNSSGINWKIPFFNKKSEEERSEPMSYTPEDASLNSSKSSSSQNAVNQHQGTSAVMADQTNASDEENEEEPQDPDSLKVDLTL